MYEVLKGILVDGLQMREEDVVPTAGREEVGLDSLAAVELAALLHTRLGVEIHDYELLDAATVADIGRLLEERLPRAGAEAAEGRP
ncbi:MULTISPECIES: phosphopantetheine-binding protein [unclassified Streptomyces]|uniref:phosphopantetheine-binding protein n=1 Tax=unclassified Streptomyces TaxID=2593676 RepID=UPI002E799066|nr:phosphopantetheine-binding protein [Streptomyces sp. JV176]MEE1802288.1 phosphopantetheine-binding protein [Streptomyces sp. JV176]